MGQEMFVFFIHSLYTARQPVLLIRASHCLRVYASLFLQSHFWACLLLDCFWELVFYTSGRCKKCSRPLAPEGMMGVEAILLYSFHATLPCTVLGTQNRLQFVLHMQLS